MHPLYERLLRSRRDFLTSSASGVGLVALASLLRDDGLLAADAVPANPLAPKPPHFAAKAKSCICIYLEGAPSQIDLFDPKPKLNELNGQKLPESMTKNVRFAFIQKEGARLLGSPRTLQEARPVRHGAVRLPAAPGDLRRRHRPDPLDAHRGVQPPSRPADDEHRRADVRPAEHGLVADLRPGQRVEEPARLRRADGRPRHQRRRLQLVERLPADHVPGRPLPQPGRAGAQPQQPRRPHRRHAAQNDRRARAT